MSLNLINTSTYNNTKVSDQSQGINISNCQIENIMFNKIINIVTSKHPNLTSALSQPYIQTNLYSPFISVYSFLWTNNINKTYLFEYSIDTQSKVTEYLAQEFDSRLQNYLFYTINDNIMQKYSSQLN
jgi:hypothetical protein